MGNKGVLKFKRSLKKLRIVDDVYMYTHSWLNWFEMRIS